MNPTRAPESETTMVEGQTQTTPWEVALDRLEHPAPGQNHWLATVRPDGSPHLITNDLVERYALTDVSPSQPARRRTRRPHKRSA